MLDELIKNRCRAETPGTERYIHLNNAGSSLMPATVYETVQSYLELEWLQGGYETAAEKAEEITGFYHAAAQFLNAQPRHIAYMANATDAYNRALSAIPLQAGDYVLTTRDDYVSNHIAFLQIHRSKGIKIVIADCLPDGGVNPDSIKKLLQQYRPKLVSVTHVPTNTGLVQDVESVGQLCKEFDTWYLVDACQSAGQLPLNIQNIHCDFLSATFRKFLRGPRGAGFLYVSDKALALDLEPQFLDLRGATWVSNENYRMKSDATRYELWEKPYALLLGAKACLEYALSIGLEIIAEEVQYLADYTRTGLQNIGHLRVLDKGPRLSGIVSFTSESIDPERLKNALKLRKVNHSYATIENARLDLQDKKAEWIIRLSPHYYNTIEEIDVALEVLR